MKRLLVFLPLLPFFAACTLKQPDTLRTITLHVVTKPLRPEGQVYVTGNVPQLGPWTPSALAMRRESDTSWTASVAIMEGTRFEYKFSLGSWQTEGVDSAGNVFPNFTLEVSRDTAIAAFVPGWGDVAGGRTGLLALNGRNLQRTGYFLVGRRWRYQQGDRRTWARADLDDSAWELVNTELLPGDYPGSGWTGIGWFRLHLAIDSTLWNKPIGLHMWQAGASELYLDGNLLFRSGIVGSSEESEVAFEDRNPRIITFGAGTEHVLAVRYSSAGWKRFRAADAEAGFTIQIGDPDYLVARRGQLVRQSSMYQMIFTAFPLSLALFHFLLFLFYTRLRENLFYALSLVCFAALIFLQFHQPHTSAPSQILFIRTVWVPLIHITIVFVLLTATTMFSTRIPRRILVYIGLALACALWSWVSPGLPSGYTPYFVIGLVAIEWVQSSLRGAFRKETDAWIIGLGMLLLMIAVAYQLLIDLEIVPPPFGQYVVYFYGIIPLILSMSTYLSRRFARTSKDLEFQLDQVKELSARSLEQERQAKEQEIRQRLLEADNQRKTSELEAARRLQLSMLPGELPKLPHLDIAVYMKTATEVGGDYYDFAVSDDGTLTVAIGDATGHGSRAGTMVTVTKSLFHELATKPDLVGILDHYNQTIRRLNLGQLYMAFALARFSNGRMITTSAGMPPVIVYRAAARSVEEIAVKGMPLGGVAVFPYQQRSVELSKGDTVLLMSDGFPEMFNEQRETLDMDRGKEFFREVGDKSPQEIINHLEHAAVLWANGKPQQDDMTFVVLKVL